MLDVILNALAALYFVLAVILTVFVSSFGVLVLLYIFKRKDKPQSPAVGDDQLLSVTIQLPVYNEQYVAARLIDAVCAMEYPRHKFSVQILDDSTDETVTICKERAEYWQSQGVDCQHVRRPNREGYKAGALAYGLTLLKTDCVAIFDADFVPPADFLRRSMPHFNSGDDIALIQTRWSHLNLDYNWLTRAQAINIDGHFVVEQVARSRGYLPMSMNGTGGIWRVKAIEDAGGWSAITLTEDLDLSYRALMRGWRFVYLMDVPVPGELPPQIAAWKVQQARWATGSTQCLIRHAVPLMRSPKFPLWKKFMGLMHLSQYAIQPVIFLLFILTPILLAGDMFNKIPDMRIIGIVSIIPPVLLIIGQVELYTRPTNLLYFPFQFLTGAAIVLSNTIAVLKAFNLNKIQEFKRTPKFRITNRQDRWASQRYALKVDWTTVGELVLAAYAFFGFYLALDRFPALAPYMLTYTIAFISFAAWNYYQTRRVAG